MLTPYFCSFVPAYLYGVFIYNIAKKEKKKGRLDVKVEIRLRASERITKQYYSQWKLVKGKV